MDIVAFIQSGMLENYCLGFCSAAEIAEIEDLSAKHPLVKNEIERIRRHFEGHLCKTAIQPAASVKNAVMRSIYRQHALTDKSYPPLIDENTNAAELRAWAFYNAVKMPAEDFDNLFIMEMPSTEQLINFVVAAKKGHDEEVHSDFTEYLFVIEGSCTMDFNGNKKSYVEGDIIIIRPHVYHAALVSSVKPMLALVQRQFIN